MEPTEETNEETPMDSRIRQVKFMRMVQGLDGAWNKDDYNLGLYNGLEAADSALDDREPEYRDMPDDTEGGGECNDS